MIRLSEFALTHSELSISHVHGLESRVVRDVFGQDRFENRKGFLLPLHPNERQTLEHFAAGEIRLFLQNFVGLLKGFLVIVIVQPVCGNKEKKALDSLNFL